MGSTNLAYGIYDVYQRLDASGEQEYVLLQCPEPLGPRGSSSGFDAEAFMSKVLDFLVERLSEILGQATFRGGLANRRSPKWFAYDLMAVWDHAGVKKYIAWKTVDSRAVICVGLWRKK